MDSINAGNKRTVWSKDELQRMFDLIMIEKECNDRDIGEIGSHFWERKASEFPGKTDKELAKKWNNLKAVYKFHHDEIMKYPSGGI